MLTFLIFSKTILSKELFFNIHKEFRHYGEKVINYLFLHYHYYFIPMIIWKYLFTTYKNLSCLEIK